MDEFFTELVKVVFFFFFFFFITVFYYIALQLKNGNFFLRDFVLVLGCAPSRGFF